jgi:hypothetical protein
LMLGMRQDSLDIYFPAPLGKFAQLLGLIFIARLRLHV